MEFKRFGERLNKHFEEMIKGVNQLYEVEVNKDAMWNLYLDSFPEGTNKMFRKRREYDCGCCHHFIRTVGNVVVIKNCEVHTIWEFDAGNETYQPVIDALDAFVKSATVTNIYIPAERRIGTISNYEVIGYKNIEWNHMYIQIPKELCRDKYLISTERSKARDTKNVFKRSLDEISEAAVETVLELIAQNSLYRGGEWKGALECFQNYQKEYSSVPESKKDLWAWEKSNEAGMSIGRIRNHSMGVLLTDISEGMDLDKAVRKYEAIVAPTNYKRPKPVFTLRMLDETKRSLEEGGYLASLPRRFANLDDITVNNVLFANKDAADRMMKSAGDVFAEMSKGIPISPKKFTKVEEVPIEKFISDVLPMTNSMEVLFEKRLETNLCSLIAPINKEAPTMFKWNNPFSWAYTGNIADSDIRENVKRAGGAVDGVLRFSIQWNEDGTDNCDLDAHCKEPNGNEISFRNKVSSYTRGSLDVDIINPGGDVAVENITWANKNHLIPGTYQFFVHQYSGSVKKGFRAEIEMDGEVYSFDYPNKMRTREKVSVADVIVDNHGNFTIKERLQSANSQISSKEIWGISTNQFIPVSVVCYSPNYWDEQQQGHKHVMFMLKGCKNPEAPNGMFNEYLREEFMKYKHVLEALGAKLSVDNAEDQLSGIGFSTTKRNELFVKVKGQTERVIKVKI